MRHRFLSDWIVKKKEKHQTESFHDENVQKKNPSKEDVHYDKSIE